MSHTHYQSLNSYLRATFGDKVYKLSLNGSMTCPNRDGKISNKGCIFCSEGGSGDFAQSSKYSITLQIEKGKALVGNKCKSGKYIAYFQAFTNTYAPIEHLEAIFTEAISHKDIVALSIATRPDCISDEILELISKLNKIKPVWIELGLQTIHPKTSEYIRRGYPLECFDITMEKLVSLGIEVIVHAIIGLPNETDEMIFDTVRYIGNSGAKGIKLQLLHILKNTDLAEDYKNGKFKALSLEKYIDIVCKCIEILPPHIIIHRITGDGPKNILIAPLWSGDKKNVLNSLNREFEARNIVQGSKFISQDF